MESMFIVMPSSDMAITPPITATGIPTAVISAVRASRKTHNTISTSAKPKKPDCSRVRKRFLT